MWRKVHEADLVSKLSLEEIDAFRGTSADSGDPITAAIADEVAYVRGIIRSAPTKVRMCEEEGTLPSSLISPAMDHLRFDVLTRMDIKVNESRTLAYQKAIELFNDVRAGKFIPESDAVTDGSVDIAGSPASGTVHPHRLLD